MTPTRAAPAGPLWVLIALCALAVAGCPRSTHHGDPTDASGPDSALDGGGNASDAGWVDPPTATTAPAESSEIFLNPERGFYRTLALYDDRDYQWVREGGSTLAHSYVRLDDYRDRPLDAPLLDAVAAGFAEARVAGIKIILRFAYNFGPYPDSEPDASKAQILEHLQQLQPLLAQHRDVIAVVQAGFIGAWGEWHTSTNGLLDNPQDKFDVLEAVLDAVGEDRQVQLRYPPYKDEGYGGPLPPELAHGVGYPARIGHHNDCFLASDTDWGTYPSGEEERWKTYLAEDTLYVAMGGETCNVNPPRSDCASALAELARLHYTYINAEYHPDVVAGWEAQGCRDALERGLGYRLVVREVTAPPVARPGGVIPLSLTLENVGWAAPINARPVWVVLTGPEEHTAELDVDPRWWLPGEPSVIAARLQLPANLVAGSYALALWLPDAAASLRDDPRFAIRLANDSLWDPQTGHNRLAGVTIDPAGPGSADPAASAFALRP